MIIHNSYPDNLLDILSDFFPLCDGDYTGVQLSEISYFPTPAIMFFYFCISLFDTLISHGVEIVFVRGIRGIWELKCSGEGWNHRTSVVS